MPFKQRQEGLRAIAAKLGVATLLEGSVRRAGDRVRIVAQLIDADTDQHLWAETYDRQLTDVFAIQTDVALQIAAALQAELSADERTRIHKEPTRDLQAYQLYLQGRHCLVKFTEPGIRRGIEYFEQAIAMAKRAQGVDPLAHRTDVASVLVRAGRYDEAVQAATRAVEFDPDDPRGRSILGWAHLKNGNPDRGLAELERAVSLAPGNTLFWAQLGQAYALAGRVGQARDVLRQLQDLARERYVSPYHLAYIYT